LMLARSLVKPRNVYNLEISWSRIYKGCSFWNNVHNGSINMNPLVADMLEIPLPTKSVDIITSSHALEPNGNRLDKILNELFRVSRYKCILFEPHYENCSREGKERMDKLGYIKDIQKTVCQLGGIVEEIIPITNFASSLNPTSCFVIKVPNSDIKYYEGNCFTVPGTNFMLKKYDDCYHSIDTGLVFPSIKSIPILRSQNAILASKF
jgi:hypothetical protein